MLRAWKLHYFLFRQPFPAYGGDINRKLFILSVPVLMSTKTIAWLQENDCHVVVMESTGKYWIPVFNLMEDSFFLTLANPSFTKTFPGNKTDRRDAKWLAELHRLGLVQPSFIPPKHIRELRELSRYRHKLIRDRSAEKSRIHNILTVCNLMLSSVATDIFGKSGMNIMHALLRSKSFDEDLLSNLVMGKLREKIPQPICALKGHLTSTQAAKLSVALDNLKNFDDKIAQIERLIEDKSHDLQPAIHYFALVLLLGKLLRLLSFRRLEPICLFSLPLIIFVSGQAYALRIMKQEANGVLLKQKREICISKPF